MYIYLLWWPCKDHDQQIHNNVIYHMYLTKKSFMLHNGWGSDDSFYNRAVFRGKGGGLLYFYFAKYNLEKDEKLYLLTNKDKLSIGPR